MKDNKVSVHAQAINLARRWSVQNENDLMQVRGLLFDKDFSIDEPERSH
jgi:hypothetical protein